MHGFGHIDNVLGHNDHGPVYTFLEFNEVEQGIRGGLDEPFVKIVLFNEAQKSGLIVQKRPLCIPGFIDVLDMKMMEKIIHMREDNPADPFDREEEEKAQIKSKFRVGKVHGFEPGVKVKKIENPFIFAGEHHNTVRLDSFYFFQIMVVQGNFFDQAGDDFADDIAFVAGVKTGKIFAAVSQQAVDGPAYPGFDSCCQVIQRLQEAH